MKFCFNQWHKSALSFGTCNALQCNSFGTICNALAVKAAHISLICV